MPMEKTKGVTAARITFSWAIQSDNLRGWADHNPTLFVQASNDCMFASVGG